MYKSINYWGLQRGENGTELSKSVLLLEERATGGGGGGGGGQIFNFFLGGGGLLGVPGIFWGEWKMLCPSLRMKKKMRVTPGLGPSIYRSTVHPQKYQEFQAPQKNI